MAYYRKYIFPVPTRITRGFLQDLECIFEDAKKKEEDKNEKEYRDRLNKRIADIDGMRIGEDIKKSLKEDAEESVYRPRNSVRTTYRIYCDETIEFDSIKEILDKETIIPEKIHALVMECDAPREMVSLRLDFDNRGSMFSSRVCKVSSSDHSLLSGHFEKIVKIFRKHRTSYSWIFRNKLSYFMVAFVACLWPVYKILYSNNLLDNTEFGLWFMSICMILITSFMGGVVFLPVIDWVFPYFSFELSDSNIKSPNKLARIFLSTLFVSSLCSLVYDIFSNLWHFVR